MTQGGAKHLTALKPGALKPGAPLRLWRAGLQTASLLVERAIARLRDHETSLQVTVSCAKTRSSTAPWAKSTQRAVLSISNNKCATLGAQTALDLLISTALRGIHEKTPSGFAYSWSWVAMIARGGWRGGASFAAAGAIRIRRFPVATQPQTPHLYIDTAAGLVIMPDGARHSIREVSATTPWQRIGYPDKEARTGVKDREDVVPIHPDMQIVAAASVALGMLSRAAADNAVAASSPLGPTRDQIRLALALVFGPVVLLRCANHAPAGDSQGAARARAPQDWPSDPKSLVDMEDFRGIISVAGHDRDYLPSRVVVTSAMQATLDEVEALGLFYYTLAGEEVMSAIHNLDDKEVLLMLAILALRDGATKSNRVKLDALCARASHHAILTAHSKIASMRRRVAAVTKSGSVTSNHNSDKGKICA